MSEVPLAGSHPDRGQGASAAVYRHPACAPREPCLRHPVVLRAILTLALVLGTVTSWAGDRLQLGDPVPDVLPETFLKGEPIRSISSDKVYLIEFWASGCPNCVMGSPSLGEIQSAFKGKGLVVMAVHVPEGAEGQDKEYLADFISKSDDKINFTIAVDNRNGDFRNAWKTYDGDGIPRCLVVAGGKLVYAGSPERLWGLPRSARLSMSKLRAILSAEEAERRRDEKSKARKAPRAALSKEVEDK